MDKTLKRLNRGSVDYISVPDLANSREYIILDTRKKEEYSVSHLRDAIWTGYREFRIDHIPDYVTDKNTPIVVYCSVGVRSEDIGEKLREAGYSNVKNLYGGIFEWKNKGFPVFNMDGKETDTVHAFSKRWGKLLKMGVKVYNDAASGKNE